MFENFPIWTSGHILAAPHERRLLNDLLSNYNVLERPVANESEPLIVSFGISLQQIIDMVSVAQ